MRLFFVLLGALTLHTRGSLFLDEEGFGDAQPGSDKEFYKYEDATASSLDAIPIENLEDAFEVLMDSLEESFRWSEFYVSKLQRMRADVLEYCQSSIKDLISLGKQIFTSKEAILVFLTYRMDTDGLAANWNPVLREFNHAIRALFDLQGKFCLTADARGDVCRLHMHAVGMFRLIVLDRGDIGVAKMAAAEVHLISALKKAMNEDSIDVADIHISSIYGLEKEVFDRHQEASILVEAEAKRGDLGKWVMRSSLVVPHPNRDIAAILSSQVNMLGLLVQDLLVAYEKYPFFQDKLRRLPQLALVLSSVSVVLKIAVKVAVSTKPELVVLLAGCLDVEDAQLIVSQWDSIADNLVIRTVFELENSVCPTNPASSVCDLYKSAAHAFVAGKDTVAKFEAQVQAALVSVGA